jgi:hypothetical protein
MDPEYQALNYDVTPGEYVNVVICELGKVPINSISMNIKFIQANQTDGSKSKAPQRSDGNSPLIGNID